MFQNAHVITLHITVQCTLQTCDVNATSLTYFTIDENWNVI